MANRPVFIPMHGTHAPWVEAQPVEFTFHSGFSASQRQRSVRSLHEAFCAQTPKSVLEVSTASEAKLGWMLSAFNLRVAFGETHIPLECAFQASKVFENGEQYTDLYLLEEHRIKQIKKDERLKNSGGITAFRFQGEAWPTEPKTAFYDWLYISALFRQHRDRLDELAAYDAFTDIMFNPKKSLNCQARSCAILSALHRAGRLEEALASKEAFIRIVYPKTMVQGRLPF